jgi:hypothetical protein
VSQAAASVEGEKRRGRKRRLHTARQKLRIVTLVFGTGDRERSLNDGLIPNVREVRVAPGTRYHRVEGNRRASGEEGRVSDLPPEIRKVTIRN